jgi:serine/threonine protein kinase
VNTSAEAVDGLTDAALGRVGSILNQKWRLDALLGLGGTAAVYAATHRNGNRVAIKILHAHHSLDEAVRMRLQQEGYVANLIDHPGAVRILDDDRAEDGALFLVMELLAGESLDTRLRRKGWRLPREEALGITYSLLDVLAAAHAKGVVHHDIKPDNIFITQQGQVKVLDFGIARLVDVPQPIHRTRNGGVFGTLGFMAPEQALARVEEIDARTDLWATGATLFTLLTGRLVHQAATVNEQLVTAATCLAPPLASVLPDVPPALALLIDRALAFKPEDRWQSAAEMQEAVRAAAIAAMGPLTEPLLQPPRVSVEVDVYDVSRARERLAAEARDRLATGSAPFPLATPMRFSVLPAPPPRFSLVAAEEPHPGRRWVVRATAAAALLLVGVGVSQAWRTHAPGAASKTAGPDAPSVLLPAEPAAPPGPIVAEVEPRLAEDSGEQRKPLVRRPPPKPAGAPILTAPPVRRPARSVTDDDALWGRRH